MVMSWQARAEYLESIRLRYHNAKRAQKTAILDEYCRATGMHRKSVVRALHQRINDLARHGVARVPRKRGRKGVYKGDAEFLDALRKVWRETEFMCAKNLTGNIAEWVPSVERFHGEFTEEVRSKLLRVSAATVDRILTPYRAQHGKGRCGTKPGTLLRTQIPIRAESWDVSLPGYLEADTVAHCGESMAGQFIWSLTATDIFSQWTEIRCMFHKSASAALEAIKSIEKALPFELIAFDSDNGGEFINHYLMRYFALRDHKVYFTRSREYKKNDNAHVEQKNYTHVRQLLHYQRIDNVELVDPLNQVLHDWSILRNHFFPVRKLLRKERLGSRCFKHYDAPKTPYRRLIECPHVPPSVKEFLTQQHATLDPVVLRRSIRRTLNQLLKYASVTSICEASNPQIVVAR